MKQDNNSARSSLRWAVFGASGFVGRGIAREIQARGDHLAEHQALRLRVDTGLASEILTARLREDLDHLAQSIAGVDIVINAAGLAEPDAARSAELTGANALWPAVLAEAADRAGAARMVHLSSAAVQGRMAILDETRITQPFSPYSESKALGERVLLTLRDEGRESASRWGTDIVILRATSVQGPGRGTSGGLHRIASSRLSSVAGQGDRPSAVSSLQSLAEAVVAVGSHKGEVPEIVLQPWDGATTSEVLELAGDGRRPARLPTGLCRAGVAALLAAGRVSPRFSGLGRRAEMLWFGQRQVDGWLVESGLSPTGSNGPSGNLHAALARGAS